jgi:hypothetical protein
VQHVRLRIDEDTQIAAAVLGDEGAAPFEGGADMGGGLTVASY